MAYTTIKKPSDYFETKLYTGDDTNNREISLGLTPDLTWIKARNVAYGHTLFDRIRGLGFSLSSNSTNADRNVGSEFSWSNSGCTTDSFTVDRGTNETLNETGRPMVAWNWLANGAGAANTDGSISSTVSANTTSGFSIVSYTGNGSAGATVGHGLGVTPKMVIVKKRSASGFNWVTQHASIFNSSDTIVALDSASAAYTQGTANFNGTAAGSSVFTIGGGGNTNDNGATYIAYCFAEKQGFSKIGSYIGNGSSDGVFCYTGMKPSFVIIKNTDAGESWSMFDGKRPDSNQTNGLYQLQPNTSSPEYQGAPLIDFVSNGFKLRTATNSLNVTQNYIYMAFAEQPLVGDNPATAR